MSNEQINGSGSENGQDNGSITTLTGMYEDYFLDYASYVILERAVPAGPDGLKPVQRRILHAMKEMDDGRFHKVANIIGQTMQFHPHGDAAIGDALVNMGQKDLLIDCQGNWGDYRTDASAAAPRYIEGRLTKFALAVAFNPQTTEWQTSYDGRKREPIHLPMKFPMLLAQGAEGIAVGLSTKILPHNFQELIKASIKILQGKSVKIYPDFPTGGMIDVSDYQGGRRGGRAKVRATIEKVDKQHLVIRDLPYGITTSNLIDSILKANDKGKIKVKHVSDNTAADIEVLIELASGYSPDVAIDALYAFTNCEISISPNACVIIDDKPHFLSVEEILQQNTEQTKELLRQELTIRKRELEEKLLFANLEKIFIEKRIYRDIEEAESWEEVLEVVEEGLRKYVRTPNEPGRRGDRRLKLLRELTQEDFVRLTEIRIKRISKYNTFKAEEQIEGLEGDLEEVDLQLANLTEYAIAYFERILDKFGKGRERTTIITTFDKVEVTAVAANNTKLYVDRKNGFVGAGIKKEGEFVADCSDIDDIIIFRRDGNFQVTRIADKTFVGKDIIHVDIWRRGDDRTTYNMAYLDGKSGRTMAKRFQVKAITRDKDYDLTKGNKGSKVLYFSANPNGEAEIVQVQLTQNSRAREKQFDFDFGELAIKGRNSQGNILTRYPVRQIKLKEVGKSTLGAMKVWIDKVSGRLNTDERGQLLGAFDTGDLLLAIYKNGSYELSGLELPKKYNPEETLYVGKYDPEQVISAVYYEGERKCTLVKRFQIETSTLDQVYEFLTDHRSTKLFYAGIAQEPLLQYGVRTKKGKETREVNLNEFIDVKGWKALGNKLEDSRITDVKVRDLDPPPVEEADDSVPPANRGSQASLFE